MLLVRYRIGALEDWLAANELDLALAAGIVSDALPDEDLLPAATEWARSQSGKAGPTLRTIRTTMYSHVIDQLGPGTVLQLPT